MRGVVRGITTTAGPRRERNPLGMIARARTDHATGTFGIRQMGDPVVGAPKLEAEYWLEILTLEQDLRSQPGRQPRCDIERRLPRHIVDPAT